MVELAMLLMLTAVLAVLVMTYVRGRGTRPDAAADLDGDGGEQPKSSWFGGRSQPAESGTLQVTGVSPPGEPTGVQYVTITGTLSGPSQPPTVVYQRFAWDTRQWPMPGDQLEVFYRPGKPEAWQPEHPGLRNYLRP